MKSLTETKLVKGAKYDVDSLELSDWTGPADTDTLFYGNYFDSDGVYLGADEDGNEPLFAGNPQPINATKSHDEAIMVKHSDGVYQMDGAATVEDWSEVRAEADEVEHLGKLAGWGEWTDAYRVHVNGCDLYYFAR